MERRDLQVVQGITEGRGGQFRADRPHESPAVQHGKTDGHERMVEAPGESRGRAIHAKEQRTGPQAVLKVDGPLCLLGCFPKWEEMRKAERPISWVEGAQRRAAIGEPQRTGATQQAGATAQWEENAQAKQQQRRARQRQSWRKGQRQQTRATARHHRRQSRLPECEGVG